MGLLETQTEWHHVYVCMYVCMYRDVCRYVPVCVFIYVYFKDGHISIPLHASIRYIISVYHCMHVLGIFCLEVTRVWWVLIITLYLYSNTVQHAHNDRSRKLNFSVMTVICSIGFICFRDFITAHFKLLSSVGRRASMCVKISSSILSHTRVLVSLAPPTALLYLDMSSWLQEDGEELQQGSGDGGLWWPYLRWISFLPLCGPPILPLWGHHVFPSWKYMFPSLHALVLHWSA